MKKIFNRRILFIAFTVLSIVCMMVIFGFSSKDAMESTEQSNTITEIFVRIFEDGYENMSPAEKQLLIDEYDGVVRKIAHFSIFACLGFLTYFSAGILRYIPKRAFKACIISVPVCILFAVTDEYHQTFTEGRSAQLSDVFIDSMGVIAGTAAAIAAVYVFGMIVKTKRN